MDILLLMLLVWAYNEQPKDVEAEEHRDGTADPSTDCQLHDARRDEHAHCHMAVCNGS